MRHTQGLWGERISPQSRTPFSPSYQDFCLTTRLFLTYTQKYRLLCSLLSSWHFRLLFQELCCEYALSRIKAVFLLCVSYRVAWSLFCQKMKFPWLYQLHLLRTWSWVVTMERFAFCSAELLTRLLRNFWSISKWKQNYTQNRWGIKERERCLADMARFPVSLKSRTFRLEIKRNGPFWLCLIGIFGTTSEAGPL